MTLLITVFAAIISTIVWYIKRQCNLRAWHIMRALLGSFDYVVC